MNSFLFKKIVVLLASASLALSMVACGNAGKGASDGSRKMNLAVQPSCAFLPIYVARANGWIEDAVKDMDVTVTWTDFESGPPMNESFVAGQQDIGVIGDVPAVSAVSMGQQLVWIAAESGGAHYAILTMADSDITSPADLKGTRIGVTIGSQGQNLVEKALQLSGISPEEVQLINISQGDAEAVLTNREVEAVSLWEPNVSRLTQSGQMKVIADGNDVGCNGENLVIAKKDYVEQNPDLVKVYLEQYYRGVKALEEDPSGCCELVAKYFGLEPKLIESTLEKYNFTMKFEESDVAAMKDTVSFLMRIGVEKKEIDVEDYIEDTIARAVLSAHQ